MYKEKIGLIGGFGGYATLDFYRRFLEVFASTSEREYPHIIIDNNFTMPSRTKSLLTGDGHDEIVEQIAESMRMLIENHADKIILVCGTAHFFLPDVYTQVPEARARVVDIIDTLGMELQVQDKKTVLIIAAEGTLSKNLYSKRLDKYSVSCVEPKECDYREIRYFIEGVKQNKMDREMARRFMRFLDKFEVSDVVLGCTEFPVLVKYIVDNKLVDTMCSYQFYDPLEVVLNKLKMTLV